MSRSRSKKSKGAQTPLFIQKLIDMLEDQSINHIISWTSSNDSFHIKSISQFTETILPRFFKHNNFSSFIRQLNMYGFRKIRHQDGQNVYQNQNFKRGNRSLLKNIKRKVNLQKQDRVALYAQQGHSNHTLARQVQDMKTKQKDLQQICRHLLLQNHKLIEQNNNLMKKMKDDQKRKQRKIQQLLIAMIAVSQNKHPAITSSHNGQAVSYQDYQPNNLGNMLSIMTNKNDTDLNLLNQKSQDTPLQVLTNALSRNKSMKQFKQMLENYYNNGIKQKNPSSMNNMDDVRLTRKRTSSILNNDINKNDLNMKFNRVLPQKNQNYSLLHDDESSGFHFQPDIDNSSRQNYSHHFNENDPTNPVHQDEDGFISINDFMNLDEQKPIIEDQQNIHLEQSN